MKVETLDYNRMGIRMDLWKIIRTYFLLQIYYDLEHDRDKDWTKWKTQLGWTEEDGFKGLDSLWVRATYGHNDVDRREYSLSNFLNYKGWMSPIENPWRDLETGSIWIVYTEKEWKQVIDRGFADSHPRSNITYEDQDGLNATHCLECHF